MKRIGMIAVALMVMAGVAVAGFDMFTAKRFTTIVAPTVLTPGQAVTNTTATVVDCAGLPGVAALVIGYDANDMVSSTLSVTVQTSATTNGTFATVTNGNGAAMSFTFTGAAGYYVTNVVPNAQSRYWRAIVSAGATTTNAEAGVLLITE